jgi:hypothetical protein
MQQTRERRAPLRFSQEEVHYASRPFERLSCSACGLTHRSFDAVNDCRQRKRRRRTMELTSRLAPDPVLPSSPPVASPPVAPLPLPPTMYGSNRNPQEFQSLLKKQEMVWCRNCSQAWFGPKPSGAIKNPKPKPKDPKPQQIVLYVSVDSPFSCGKAEEQREMWKNAVGRCHQHRVAKGATAKQLAI